MFNIYAFVYLFIFHNPVSAVYKDPCCLLPVNKSVNKPQQGGAKV